MLEGPSGQDKDDYMGYTQNSILVFSEHQLNTDQLENSYVSTALDGYSIHTRNEHDNDDLYSIRTVKYFTDKNHFTYGIFEKEMTPNICNYAKCLSTLIKVKCLSIQIFDSDILIINEYIDGAISCTIRKESGTTAFDLTGDLNCLIEDQNKVIDALKMSYLEIEKCLESLLPLEFIYPTKKIQKQKIVKYSKIISVNPIEEIPSKFLLKSYNSVIYSAYNLKSFNISITNTAAGSKGLVIIFSGSAIQENNIVILKIKARTRTEEIEVTTFEEGNNDSVRYLKFKLPNINIPHGYDYTDILKESQKNMDAYKKMLEYQFEAGIIFDIYYSIINPIGQIDFKIFPLENIPNGGCTSSLKIE